VPLLQLSFCGSRWYLEPAGGGGGGGGVGGVGAGAGAGAGLHGGDGTGAGVGGQKGQHERGPAPLMMRCAAGGQAPQFVRLSTTMWHERERACPWRFGGAVLLHLSCRAYEQQAAVAAAT
jgi:hypothetical protein